jgi:hypothetical protein
MAFDARLAAIRSVLVPRFRGQCGVEPGSLQTVTWVAKIRWPELGRLLSFLEVWRNPGVLVLSSAWVDPLKGYAALLQPA